MEQKMKQLILMTVLLIISTTAGLAQGLYLGGGIGNTYYNTEIGEAIDQAQEISENSTAWKLFAGFQLNEFLNLEGGYRSFGSISSDVENAVLESKTSGWDIEALGRVKIAMIDVFAKAGILFWSSEATFEEVNFDESGGDFLWGLGLGVHFGSLGVRAEWESVAISKDDVSIGSPDNLSMVSLSATLGF